MPRIRLAHWHDGHAPGAEIDVTADQLRALQRDGRVNEVLAEYDSGGPLPLDPPPAFNGTDEPEAVMPAPKRGRKAAAEE